LEADARQSFDTQGYVVLRDFVEADVLAQVRGALQTLVDRQAERLLAEGKIQDPLAAAPFETRLAQLYATFLEEAPKQFRPELHLPGLFPLFFHPRLLDIVETVLGPEIRLYPNYTARPKLPDHAGTLVLWHQDGGYTGDQADTLRMVNVWTPLVPATTENGCMEFIPGTHRLGIVPHESRKHYLEIAEDYLAPRRQEAVAIELDPGDIVLFHNLLFHRGLPNRSQTIRWSLDWRYQDATQPTLRKEHGQIARSRSHPETAVSSTEAWASLSFG
jgi:ectoine hydroxylase-related dioxygenase (phytanoyl-CoA dioxygenase family)